MQGHLGLMITNPKLIIEFPKFSEIVQDSPVIEIQTENSHFIYLLILDRIFLLMIAQKGCIRNIVLARKKSKI